MIGKGKRPGIALFLERRTERQRHKPGLHVLLGLLLAFLIGIREIYYKVSQEMSRANFSFFLLSYLDLFLDNIV